MDDDALLAWFATAALPAEPYRLGKHLMVDEPAKSHGWMRERLAEGCKGLVRAAILARLRVLYAMFGEKETPDGKEIAS